MASCRMRVTSFRGLLTIRNFNSHKFLHTSTRYCIKFGRWENEPKPPYLGVKEGPLVDLPDWSYADGRPAPLGLSQKRRIRKNMEYCEKIVKLTEEVDDAVQLRRRTEEEKELRLSLFMKNRLKSKGDKQTQDQKLSCEKSSSVN